MGCPDAVESVYKRKVVVVEQWLCSGFCKVTDQSVFLTTSGSAATQDSEQEATDKLLELGALKSSEGRLVSDLNPAASELCTSNSHD